MIEQVVYEPSVLDRRLMEHPVEVATVVGSGVFFIVGVPGIVVLGWLAGLALAVGLGLVMVLTAIGMSRSMRPQVGRPRPALTHRRWWWLPGPMSGVPRLERAARIVGFLGPLVLVPFGWHWFLVPCIATLVLWAAHGVNVVANDPERG
ncbi:MAG: hypothetical protein JWN67_4467 [Actinomycetia bacterium]|nr:hypothetical protein [Actinomycetes bacterium]